VDGDGQAGQGADIDTAERPKAEQAVFNGCDHQANDIHMRGNQNALAGCAAPAAAQGVQAAQGAGMLFVRQRLPEFRDFFIDLVFIARRAGYTNQVFQHLFGFIHDLFRFHFEVWENIIRHHSLPMAQGYRPGLP
jgi:hypothetical protein